MSGKSNRLRIAGIVMLVGGCVSNDQPAATAPQAGDTTAFDGRYTGTVVSVSPAACGQSGSPLSVVIANGGLIVRFPSGRRVFGQVGVDGAIRNVQFASGNVRASGGTGQVANQEITLSLQTTEPRFTVPCIFRYSARKDA